MMIGVSLNNIASDAYGVRDLVKAAIEAEAMGYDVVWLADAPLGRRTLAAWDMVSILAAIAMRTSTIKLGTGILQPHLRNPIFLAQALATIDVLSDGRLLLGFGTGAGVGRLVRRQYEALCALRAGTGLAPEDIYRRRKLLFWESVDIMRRLWTTDKLSYDGRVFAFRDVTLGACVPLQSPHPPIIIAKGIYYPADFGGPVHHRWKSKVAGRYVLGDYESFVDISDGWTTACATPDEWAQGWELIRRTLQARGRDSTSFFRGYDCYINVDSDVGRAREEAALQIVEYHGPPVPPDVIERWMCVGTPEDVLAQLAAYVERGANLFELVIGSRDQFGQMRRFAEGVLPHLKSRFP
jgi:alkanesulfonate monooxygenase SsuD/methylene tetrahydromethanopterin reductase-like flavin-dependent oxidoreductase (luciferase family)